MIDKKAFTSGPPNGSLILHGGGDISCCIEVFRDLAGGPKATLIYIPTAFSDEQLADKRKADLDHTYAARRFGYNQAHVLHTRDRKKADQIEFVKPITDASAVWFTGGRQWRLADSYLHTRTHEELIRLLERGGVIAGSSAGATIQGSFLVRGNAQPDNNTIMIGDHQEGFGFIKCTAIDQHISYSRQFDLLQILERHAELLGIGIDQNTGIVVRKNELEVIGESYVAIFDHTFDSEDGHLRSTLPDGSYRLYFLRKGRRFDLELRELK